MSVYSYCMFIYLHCAGWHSSATLTEVLPCFFLNCKANGKVKPAKMGHGPHSSQMFVLFYVLLVLCSSVCVCVCKCVLYYCHRVATQLQLTNIIIIIIIIIFLLGLGRLTCSGIDALPSFPGASTISSSSRFAVEGVFRQSGAVHPFKVVDPVLFVF